MNLTEIYDKVKNPPTEEEVSQRNSEESLRSIVRQQEESERELWLQLERTQKFLAKIEDSIKEIQNGLIDISVSSKEIFSDIGQKRAQEAHTLKKVIKYARTGKYQSE